MSLEFILFTHTLSCVSLSLMHTLGFKHILEEERIDLVFGSWLVKDLAWRFALGGREKLLSFGGLRIGREDLARLGFDSSLPYLSWYVIVP